RIMTASVLVGATRWLMRGISANANITNANTTTAPTCVPAVAPEATIAVSAATSSTGGPGPSQAPMKNATHGDPPCNTPCTRADSRENADGASDESTDGPRPVGQSGPPTGAAAFRRAALRSRITGASAKASAPTAIWIDMMSMADPEAAAAAVTTPMTSRSRNSTTTPARTVATIPPSQNRNRLNIGRGREINSTAAPMRNGSPIAIRANNTTAPHMVPNTTLHRQRPRPDRAIADRFCGTASPAPSLPRSAPAAAAEPTNPGGHPPPRRSRLQHVNPIEQ